ncbi:hypothetical protein BU23DRAFT_563623 [Bimuria novae-zelandiae CBS 107.79]|uniref:BTB domain-containing protein n=1 Tax=Bimuria novae-zelandiae CBS 107.79 TaxID=1447943 RepID=A0A6A5VSM0_9PLEO|nr:hypothetical protein BU23DRAFT_563623 [Bimuria novae-zelandiae CBS 107.79]
MAAPVALFRDSIKSRLLKSGDYSDLTITCNGKLWKVHKALVCTQSDFFKAAVQFGGKEETNQGIIDLPEDDPVVVGYMIQYLYGPNYELPSESATEPLWIRADWKKWSSNADGKVNGMPAASKREADQKCWNLATKHMKPILSKIPNLEAKGMNGFIMLDGGSTEDQTVIATMFASHPQWQDKPNQFPLPVHRDNASIHACVYAIAEKYQLPGLKLTATTKFEASLKVMFSGKKFFETVTTAFTTTPDSDIILRDIAVKHIYDGKKSYGMYKELDKHMQTIPRLVYHLWKYEWAQTVPEVKYILRRTGGL